MDVQGEKGMVAWLQEAWEQWGSRAIHAHKAGSYGIVKRARFLESDRPEPIMAPQLLGQ